MRAGKTRLIAGVGLPKLLSPGSDWIEAGRRASPALGGLTGMALLGVLAHEVALFAWTGEVPLAGPAIGVVAGALAAVVVGLVAGSAFGQDGRAVMAFDEDDFVWMARGDFSMNTADEAPRLRASIPRLPVPAKRSSTTAPSTQPARMLKMASLR
mgnify:CR=1 FL=1